jgi:hypothetical protein
MSVISSLQDEYRRYKALAEAAIAQVGDEELNEAGQGGRRVARNSVAQGDANRQRRADHRLDFLCKEEII